MEMIPVTSSQIAAVGYDASKAILRVKFNNGGVYDYSNVLKEKFDALLAAESIGKEFSADIKKNPTLYPFVKVA